MCNWCKHLKAGRLKICHLFSLQERVSEYNQGKEEPTHRVCTVQKINTFVLDTFHDKELNQVCLHTSSCDDIMFLFFLCFWNTRGFCSSPKDKMLGTTPNETSAKFLPWTSPRVQSPVCLAVSQYWCSAFPSTLFRTCYVKWWFFCLQGSKLFWQTWRKPIQGKWNPL